MMSLQKCPSGSVRLARYSPSSRIDGVYTTTESLLVPLDSAPPKRYTLHSKLAPVRHRFTAPLTKPFGGSF